MKEIIENHKCKTYLNEDLYMLDKKDLKIKINGKIEKEKVKGNLSKPYLKFNWNFEDPAAQEKFP